MTDWLSVAEAARLYKVSDKSIRNWIKSKLLTPQKVRMNGKLQYAIDPKALEAVMQERNMTAVPIRSTGEQSRMDALERRLADVERRLARLEQERITRVEHTPITPIRIVPERQAHELPGGLVTAASFAIMHFPADPALSSGERAIHEDRVTTMVNKQIKRGELPVVEGPFKVGATRAKYALDAQGKANFYKLNHERAGFQHCKKCPHE